MDREAVVTVSELRLTREATRDGALEADRRAVTRARRWLEDAWRHGELVVDDDRAERREPARQPNRFEVSRRAVEAAERDVV